VLCTQIYFFELLREREGKGLGKGYVASLPSSNPKKKKRGEGKKWGGGAALFPRRCVTLPSHRCKKRKGKGEKKKAELGGGGGEKKRGVNRSAALVCSLVLAPAIIRAMEGNSEKKKA